MNTPPPPRPQRPSNREILADLGVEPGTPGCRRLIRTRAHQAECVQRFRRELGEWYRHPAVVAKHDAERRELEAAESRRRKREAAEAARRAAARAAWLTMPCRWKRDRLGNAAAAAATLAHAVAVAGKMQAESSPSSATRYVWSGTLALRVSDHGLGYADYGTRRQSHRGPEVVLEPGDSPAAAVQTAIESVAEYGRSADERERRDAAALIRALRAVQQNTNTG